MPDNGLIEEIREPLGNIEIVGPQEYAGSIMQLAQDYRGEMKGMEYLDANRVLWRYHLPMGEIIIDFYDKLKSNTKGYATMNYELNKYQPGKLIRLDIFVNGDRVESLSMIVHQDKAYHTGKSIVERLKELIPKHLFPIPIQAGIGNKMIARETISAIRKDVIAKCYGGDVSRKKKLLAKQKEGKKKMKAIGRVNVPQDIFIKMLKR
jgi:GTP-binding protein LepA